MDSPTYRKYNAKLHYCYRKNIITAIQLARLQQIGKLSPSYDDLPVTPDKLKSLSHEQIDEIISATEGTPDYLIAKLKDEAYRAAANERTLALRKIERRYKADLLTEDEYNSLKSQIKALPDIDAVLTFAIENLPDMHTQRKKTTLQLKNKNSPK